MSLTADTADAIIALDKALAAFDRELGYLLQHENGKYAEYTDLIEAIQGMQEISLGEGMHFNSLEEARAYRDNPQTSTLQDGFRWCVGGCGGQVLIARGFRCDECGGNSNA